MANEVEVTREELYRRVWTKPVTEVAKELGISNVGLAKICARLSVPRPPRGYWQKLEVGKAVRAPRLLPAEEVDPVRVFITPFQKPESQLQDPSVQECIRYESLPMNHIDVSQDLQGAHSIVCEAAELLENSELDSSGRIAQWNAKGKPGWLDLRVSKNSLVRALRIMSGLIKALDSRGYTFQTSEKNTHCVINGTEVKFYVWENVSRSEREPNKEEQERPWAFEKWVYTPTEQLVFVLDEHWAPRRRWSDRKGKALEHQLNEVVAGMVVAAETIRLKDIEAERSKQDWMKAEQQRVESDRRQRLEEERRDQLDTMTGLWIKSQNLKQFVGACEKFFLAQTKSSDELVARWLDWARAYADHLNPLMNGQLESVVNGSSVPEYDTIH
jgi:hypothetical protein